MLRIGVIKTGNIATSLMLELLLDERADREDIRVRVVSCGAKMTPEEAEGLVAEINKFNPELLLYSTPNPSAPGPKKVIEQLRGRKAIVIGDAPGVKMASTLEDYNLGYILVKGDAMIGARREFLDPTEMALFNADMLKVLAVAGVFRLVQVEVGKAVEAVKKGEEYLPRMVVDAEVALKYAGIENAKARENAAKAYAMAEEVGKLNVRGCFVEKEREKYLRTVNEAHELLSKAATLAKEARELEKEEDRVLRTPHYKDGRILKKRGLMGKPK